MDSSKPLIVIVPGGFHRPGHYASLTDRLRAKGYEVLTPALTVTGDADVNPNATPQTDAAHILSQLEPLLNAGAEAVFVTHSYGSVPAVECMREHTAQDRAARGLKGGIVTWVCIAGFAYPACGRNIMGGEEELPIMPYQTLQDGLLSLTAEAGPLFYSDLTPEVAEREFASLCKFQSRKSLSAVPEFLASEAQVRKTYVLCERDQTVPAEFQEMMVQIGGFERVTRLPTGHAPYLSVPDKVVEVIEGACRA